MGKWNAKSMFDTEDPYDINCKVSTKPWCHLTRAYWPPSCTEVQHGTFLWDKQKKGVQLKKKWTNRGPARVTGTLWKCCKVLTSLSPSHHRPENMWKKSSPTTKARQNKTRPQRARFSKRSPQRSLTYVFSCNFVGDIAYLAFTECSFSFVFIPVLLNYLSYFPLYLGPTIDNVSYLTLHPPQFLFKVHSFHFKVLLVFPIVFANHTWQFRSRISPPLTGRKIQHWRYILLRSFILLFDLFFWRMLAIVSNMRDKVYVVWPLARY